MRYPIKTSSGYSRKTTKQAVGDVPTIPFDIALLEWLEYWRKQILEKPGIKQAGFIVTKKLYTRIELRVVVPWSGDWEKAIDSRWAMVNDNGEIFAVRLGEGKWQTVPGVRGSIYGKSGITGCDVNGPKLFRRKKERERSK